MITFLSFVGGAIIGFIIVSIFLAIVRGGFDI